MTRKYIDCREFPRRHPFARSPSRQTAKRNCSMRPHSIAVSVHKHTDSPELRAQLKTRVSRWHGTREATRRP